VSNAGNTPYHPVEFRCNVALIRNPVEDWISEVISNKQAFMKTLICRDLGGECDKKLSARSWSEMVSTMTKHVMEKHPDTAKKMEKMHNESPEKWGKEMKPKWDAAPEV
jgi:predicted small metal-binding protein